MTISPRVLRRLLPLIAPTLLVAVAVKQVVLVHTDNLTPWKGGGFGMFATVESGSTRIVKVRLERQDGDRILSLPVQLPPELAPLVQDLTQRPTHQGAESLAVILSKLPWLEPPELDEIYSLGAPGFAAMAVAAQIEGKKPKLLSGLLEKPRAWSAGWKSSAKFGPGAAVTFDHAVVEVWQLRYDPSTRALAAKRIIDAVGVPQRDGKEGQS